MSIRERVRSLGIMRLSAAVATAALVLAMAATGSAASAATVGSAPDYRHACAAAAPAGQAECLALIRTNVANSAVATPDAASGYEPADLQSAYDLATAAASSGRGQTVALVDAYDDPTAESDLAYYRSYFDLSACTTANGCFSKVNEDGEASPLPPASGTTGWATEESLDLDMVSAICPNCHILLVEANSPEDTELGTAVNTAVSLGAGYVSNSYGGAEFSGETTDSADYYDHPGVAVTVSAGDSGYGVEFPAASPYVTSVGGTSLIRDSSTARGWSETVWGDGESGTDGDGTGSGCSAYEPKPSWQTDTGCGDRTVADVSADADPNTGVYVYDTYDQGGWLIVGGTSAASPIIASAYALAGTPVSGTYPAEYPYEHSSHLYDVTSGSNGSCGTYLCNGEVGYDGPTGLGTPDSLGAFQAVDNTVTVTNPGTQSSIKGAKITPLAITAADSDLSQTLAYSATGLPAGLSISSSTGIISGKPTAAGTSSVTVSAADDTGATGSAAFTWTVTASTVTVTSPGTQVTFKGTKITPLQIRATDSDTSQSLTYTATGLPAGLAISTAGKITGTPRTLQYTKVTVTATDSTGASGSTSFYWDDGAKGTITSGLSSTRCLTARSGSYKAGTAIEISKCNGSSSQRWIIYVGPKSEDSIELASGDKSSSDRAGCMGVTGSSTASGAKVAAYRCILTTSLVWKPGSYGHLTGEHSGKCLIDSAAGPNGTQLTIATCKNENQEHWTLP